MKDILEVSRAELEKFLWDTCSTLLVIRLGTKLMEDRVIDSDGMGDLTDIVYDLITEIRESQK